MEVVVDVRLVPTSARNPQFAKERLQRLLSDAGIAYLHLPGLGGRRKPHPNSPNGRWRQPPFRGYADYALSEEFAAAFAQLRTVAATARSCLLCAEALWWRCHRRLLADRLLADGFPVSHILPNGRLVPHRLPEFARVGRDGTLLYPSQTEGVGGDPVAGGAGKLAASAEEPHGQ